MNLDAALHCFDAFSIDPINIDAQWNKSHVLLTLADMKKGLSYMKPDGNTHRSTKKA